MINRSNRLWHQLAAGLFSAALALAASAVVSASPTPQLDPVSIGSLNQAVGVTGSVKLQAFYISVPLLGAWEINVTYSPTILDALSCENTAGTAYCNLTYLPGTVRLVGASPGGLSGTTIDLATLYFKCKTVGMSALTLTVKRFSDTNGANIGHSVVNGSIACSPAVGGVAKLPDVSSGALRSVDSSNRGNTPVAVLSAFGAFLVAGTLIWLVSRTRRAE